MEEIIYRCDECKKVKGEANHWWRLLIYCERLHIFGWNDVADITNSQPHLHLCGRECVNKRVNAFMEGRTE